MRPRLLEFLFLRPARGIARCRKGKLVDGTGREIYFFRLDGCWWNPPSDYLEILQRQEERLAKLRKRYTVVEMTCNPDGLSLE